MTRSTYIEWCNQNAGRKYPLAEGATGVSTDGNILPADIVVDLQVTVPPGLDDMFIASVWASPALLGMSIAHGTTGLFTATVARATYRPYTAVPLQPMPGTDGCSGWVVFGAPTLMQHQRWLFTSAAAGGIDVRARRILPAAPVRTLRRLGGSDTSIATQLARLVGSGLFKIYKRDAQTIQIDLTEQVTNLRNTCEKRLANSDECPVPAVRSLNDACPDADGFITITFGDCP